jgi:hypothetical protein
MAGEKSFNASTISFASETTTPLRSIRYSASGAKVQVSGVADAAKLYEAGIPDLEVTFDIVGATAIVIGDAGALTIGWGGGTDPPTGVLAATWVCTGVDTSGDEDSEIITSVTCVPATAAA